LRSSPWCISRADFTASVALLSLESMSKCRNVEIEFQSSKECTVTHTSYYLAGMGSGLYDQRKARQCRTHTRPENSSLCKKTL
jgi:hypothetical protein